jgi:hypothetical protein
MVTPVRTRVTPAAIQCDFYNCEGAEHNMKHELFVLMLNSTKTYGGGQLTPLAHARHFHAWYEDSTSSKPNFYVVSPSLSVLGATYFRAGFFTDGTICAGRVANTVSIASYHSCPRTLRTFMGSGTSSTAFSERTWANLTISSLASRAP